MTISAQSGVFSYAMQPAKVGRAGTFDESTLSWFKVLAPRIGVAGQQDQQVLVPMVGGTLTPKGSYKQARFFGGDVDLIPFLEDSFGYLLKGALGSASSTADKDSNGATSTGVNCHIFRFDPNAPASQPWMAVRKDIPEVSSRFGEIGFDCKISAMRFTIPAMGKIACRVAFIGRDFVLDDPSTWTYTNTDFEDSLSSPDAGRGSFKIGGVEYPCLGATIDIINQLTGVQQEMTVGDFALDDIIALGRAVQIRFVYKFENAQLYRKLLTGQANGTTWDSLPFIQSTSGATFAFDASFESSGTIGSTGKPYVFRVRANKVTWAAEGGIELQASGIITQTFVGTVLEPNVGQDYIQAILENDAASYA